MKIHVCISKELPRKGSTVIAPCGTIVARVDFPFMIDGDARTADLVELGNCWKCRRKLKIPDGRYLVYGLAEKEEEI